MKKDSLNSAPIPTSKKNTPRVELNARIYRETPLAFTKGVSIFDTVALISRILYPASVSFKTEAGRQSFIWSRCCHRDRAALPAPVLGIKQTFL